MASGDILDYQLRYALTAVESARREGVVRRMVFVHGVGDGVLKEELRRMLDCDVDTITSNAPDRIIHLLKPQPYERKSI